MDATGQKRSGFTLIELLIVVVIIGILATIALPKFNSTREEAFIASMVADLKNLANHQELYHADNYTYANDLASLDDLGISRGVTVTINGADVAGWAAVAVHDGVPDRQCGIFVGGASAASAVPATFAGVIACEE